MKLIISSVSGKPIYEQIKDQIRAAVLSGELAAGEALPSLRKLAKELRVSVLTVTRAYNELADEGIVENIQGKGTFVMSRGNELMRRRARQRIRRIFDETCTAAKAADIPLLDLMTMLEESYKDRP
ncbi:GntR family transcriptional regulator [Bifidobacterium phasiani]|uniref:GntR family transcriptional regulator n=1 Tax=Bifidobacterium phasiani TaxID=2834431 RepID=A0ABS6W8P8_9BIFI|nr:GntR family transcriptional regulator [Bifidobacterium phasiani]MBW3082871.1 GntR family transcriptional regulator [Bifidobacterium phasiani]